MSKKTISFFTFVFIAVSMSATLYAGCPQEMGGAECANCSKSAAVAGADPWKKFQADTIDLRQEMMIKRFDLQRENLKSVQDKNKVARLKTEIKNLQARIQDIRTKSGLPVDKCDGECGAGTGNCDKRGQGDCNGGAPCKGKM